MIAAAGVEATKTPFPWFGGKRHAAPLVWDLLGDVPHYVEPFFGGGAVLLNRPHLANRPYVSETVNDLDGLLVNFWRSVQWSPQATAEHASWPVSELDKHARSCAVLRWREEECAALLAGDPSWHDPRMAGWWVWAVCVQIGAWGQGGPWWPDETGRLRRRGRGSSDEPGVAGGLPYLGDNGRGVNHAGLREPGVAGGLPYLGDDGRGVNRPQLREPGVSGNRPHLTDDGQGVNRPQLREPGSEFHPITMPGLRRWFDALSARLRHVRIVNGDWTRVVTSGAAWSLPVRQGHGPVGIFLDPPYGDVGRVSLYGKHESLTVAEDARRWALGVGDDPRWRIVYAGFDDEGADLVAAGWSEHGWFTAGHLRGGMGNANANGHQQHRERLWASPHCHLPDADEPNLFTFEDAQ